VLWVVEREKRKTAWARNRERVLLALGRLNQIGRRWVDQGE